MRMNWKKAILGGFVAATMFAAVPQVAWAQQAGTKFTAVAGKNVLTDAAGKTLYTWDRDTAGQSTYVGAAWPLFVAPANATNVGDFTIITRADGMKIWAYKGKALYYYAQDTAAEPLKGDNVGGIWHIITQ